MKRKPLRNSLKNNVLGENSRIRTAIQNCQDGKFNPPDKLGLEFILKLLGFSKEEAKDLKGKFDPNRIRDLWYGFGKTEADVKDWIKQAMAQKANNNTAK